MIDLSSFKGVSVAVLGLGRSGLSAARALRAGGATVAAWDDSPVTRTKALEDGVPLVDLSAFDWSGCSLLILSPGIPHTYPKPNPIVASAIAADVDVVCDIELLLRAQPSSNYIGITGTNGKSTTTALMGHIINRAGKRVEIGGNFGIPALDLQALDESAFYVLEMSSYQLELIRPVPFDVAILLNISADHLERHGGMEGYVAAKTTIFDDQTTTQTAVIGVDDTHCQDIYQDLKRAGNQTVVPISTERRVEGGVYVLDGLMIDDVDGGKTGVCDLTTMAGLPGRHNWQNAAAAYATARAIGIILDDIIDGLRSYPGLVHRQEPVEVVDGVAFVNDSKATNAEAATRALACYENVYWIAGGRSKEGGLDGVDAYLKDVRHAYLVGESAEGFARYLEGKVELTVSGEIGDAVTRAYEMAKEQGAGKPIVLLSPACASFDQFVSFEARGDAFKAFVKSLPGVHQAPFDVPGLFPIKPFVSSAGEAA